MSPETIAYRRQDRGWIHLLLTAGEIGIIEDEWWLRCPCGMFGSLDHEVTLQDGKVTVYPSVVCPGGCHYSIKDGVVV